MRTGDYIGPQPITPDPFETRRVYRVDLPDGSAQYSSRVDLLRPFIDPTPNLASIASHWRYVNGFGTGTIFQDVHRVPPTIPTVLGTGDPDTSMMQALQSLQGQDVVLLLSGGIDSRTLMALLHGAGVSFRTITYGMPTMPDWQIAQRVSEVDGVEWQGIDIRTLPEEDLWTAMENTALISEGTYNIAHAAVLPTLSRQNPSAVFVDGAFGGLLRGGLANQLLVRGQADLASHDAERIERWLVVQDVMVFHPDIREEMIRGSRQVLQEALDGMPAFARTHGREWIDEFFLRWYVPGFVANPLRIYDAWIRSEMPFLDPHVVADVLALPARSRSRARLFRTWIERYRPVLKTVPVVGKKALIPWICAGDPWLTALYSKFGPKHGFADAGQIELGVMSSIQGHLSDVVEDTMARSVVPFHLPYIKELTRLAMEQRDPSAQQPFFTWLTLALALRA